MEVRFRETGACFSARTVVGRYVWRVYHVFVSGSQVGLILSGRGRRADSPGFSIFPPSNAFSKIIGKIH